MNRNKFLNLSIALPLVSGFGGKSSVFEGPARMIISFQLAGKMEAFFNAISQGAMKGKSEKEQDDFRKAHGFERVGPALDYFKKL